MISGQETTEVLVVGAGPTGLAVSAALRQQGIEVITVDATVEAAHTSRAAVVHARTLEVLEELGVTEALLERGIKVPVFRARDRDRILLEVDFHTIPSRYKFTLMCPQDETEAVLRKRLKALGGEVRQGAKATRVDQCADGVVAEMERNGIRSRVEARFVVGADGGHSIVRQCAGIPFEGGSYPQSFVLADVRMTWPLSRDEVTLFFSDAGLVVVAPLPHDRFRIVATADEAPDQPPLAFMQALLDERGPARERGRIDEIVWSSRFLVHHRLARTFRKEMIFLAGDAAHVHSPAGGQGMNTGLQDALELAHALALALRHGDTAGIDAYPGHRRAIAKRIVELTDRMTRAATLQSSLGKHVRNAVVSLLGHLPPVQHAIATNLAELNNR